jgi:hypothetical protein
VLSRTRNLLLAVGLSALATAVAVPALATASPSEAPASTSAQGPTSTVEDFAYPGAAKILREQGIKLIKGDGHLQLAACDGSPSQITVHARADQSINKASAFCFQADSKSGYLTLELTDVWGVETADHPVSAHLTADGKTETVNVAKGAYEGVGEGLPGGAPTVLVELRVTG